MKPKPLARAAKSGPVPAAAQAFTATEPKSIIEDGKGSGNKGAIQPSAALNQKPGATPKLGAAGGEAQRPKAGAIAAKPKPSHSAGLANPASAPKPTASPKPAAARPAATTSGAIKPAAAKPAATAKTAASGKPEKKPAAKAAEHKKPQVAAQPKPRTAAKAKSPGE